MNPSFVLRVAIRSLARSPLFTAGVLLALLVGLGANAAVLTVAINVLRQATPFPEAERILQIDGQNTREGQSEAWPLSYPDITDWEREWSAVDALAPRTGARSFNLASGSTVLHVEGELVGSAYFPILGVRAAIGRTLEPREDQPGIHRVVVISDGLWRDLYGGDPGAVGRPLAIDGKSYEVVGVLPPGFHGLSDDASVWLPVTLAGDLYGAAYLSQRPFRWLSAIARLAPGSTLADAQAELDRIMASLASAHPATNGGIGAVATALPDHVWGDLRARVLLLLGGSALLLLIACANLSTLVLARAAAREREVAVQAALGAPRLVIVQQFVLEMLLLTTVGTLLALLVASPVARALVAFSGVDFPSWVAAGVSPGVAGVMVLVGLAVVGLSAIWPAIQGSRPRITEALRSGGRGTAAGARRFDARSTLVVAEVGLALVLLVGAGLMVRGYGALRNAPLGFDPEGVLTLRFDMKDARFATNEPYRQFIRELLDETASMPGVARVAVEGPGLPTDDWSGIHMITEDEVTAGVTEPSPYLFHLVSPGYFATLGISPLGGRDFLASDYDLGTSQPVTIVSKSLAARAWRGADPIGKRIKFGPATSKASWYTVVGVVEDVRHTGVNREAPPDPHIYFSIFQLVPRTPPIVNLLARTEGDPLALVPTLRARVAGFAPSQPFFDAQSLGQRLARQTAQPQFLVTLMFTFAVLSLCLAVFGTYGLVASRVADQRREIGIRRALGATTGHVLALIVRRAALLAGTGLALGLAAAVGLSRFLEPVLYGIEPNDPLILAAAAGGLLLVSMAAACVPAWRATAVDPMRVLNLE
jgi:predicted permease